MYCRRGENVIAVCLGNGLQNCFGGYVWNFEKARWRGAPKVALVLEAVVDGETFTLQSDESFVTHPSPILYDDIRNGEYYDARLELPGWNAVGFDDSGWQPAVAAPRPAGDERICGAEPIVVTGEMTPVSITPVDDGYLYDFGKNCAGLCRLSIDGKAGQELTLYHGEILQDGRLYMRNTKFDENDYVQKDIYICKDGKQTHVPSFTYHGFQYVFVKGITEAQATPELLTYLVMNSDLPERGNFHCSDEMVNKLQEYTRRSTLANFFYIPTDCPQREKNGWTADAALSAEHTLLNLAPENSYREWMHNIRKAMKENGDLPGIVPTQDWGYGIGPAWDNVLVYLPYFTYLYRGDKGILQENATAIFRYLHYLHTRLDDRGIVNYGLGDWCTPDRDENDFKAPNEVTSTLLSMDLCEKAAYIFGELGLTLEKQFADSLYAQIREAARTYLFDHATMQVLGDCQSAQAMGIFYNLFEPGEKPTAFAHLLELIEREDGHMDTGVLGARVIFHVLSDYGYSDLAYSMITRTDFPSYGNWVERGATSLWEDFHPEGGKINSHNHHFWGDISHWFIRQLAGIHLNPYRTGPNHAEIRPRFVEALEFAEGYHIAPAGKISVRWDRKDGGVLLKVEAPEEITGRILPDEGWIFEDGHCVKPLTTGEYRLKPAN